MAKSRKLEETLAVLIEAKDDPTSDTAIGGLHQVLRSKYSVAVARDAIAALSIYRQDDVLWQRVCQAGVGCAQLIM